MPISVRESEIRRLIRFYRDAVKRLAKGYIGGFDFERARLSAQTRSALQILEQLDEKTVRWARKNIEQLYRAASSEAEKTFFKRFGFEKTARKRAAQFGVVNNQAIQALLNDPEVGFLTGMQSGIQQIKDRMRLVQNQAKMLRTRQKLFDETIARVGFLEGQNIATVRDKIVDEIVSLKRHADLKILPQALALPPENIVRNVANLPFVKIPDRRSLTGYRNLRVDHYAEMLARTKTAQAANLARRNRALEHNVQLIQISKNKPLQDDACFLYIGKVFALTQSAKTEYGVPHVSELPNGGAPFHPNCTHSELPFISEYRDPKEIELALQPPPAWALNKTWPQVQKEYKRRGGARAISEMNKAAKQLGRTTGGRERRRAEEGLPPDDKPPPVPPRTPPVPQPQTQPPAPVAARRPSIGFQIPTELASLKTNEFWGKALADPKTLKKIENVFDDMVKGLGEKFGLEVKISRGGFGAWGGEVNPNTIIEVFGSEAKAKQMAAAVGWTFGQEASYGFKVLKAGTKAAKAAKSKGVLIKLKRALTEKELKILAKQRGIAGFTPVGKKQLWFGIVDDVDPEDFHRRVLHAIETAADRNAKYIIEKSSVQAVKDFYHENLRAIVKRNRNAHEAVRKARVQLHKIVNDAANNEVFGSRYYSANLRFEDGFRMADILSPTGEARFLRELGNLEELPLDVWVSKVGKRVRKSLEKSVIRPIRRRIKVIAKEQRQILQAQKELDVTFKKRAENMVRQRLGLKPSEKVPDDFSLMVFDETYKLRRTDPINKQLNKRFYELDNLATAEKKMARLRLREETLAAMKEIREMGGVSLDLMKESAPDLVKESEKIMKYFPRDWLEQAADGPRVETLWISSADKGGYHRRGLLNPDGKTARPARVAVNKTAKASDERLHEVLIHEWGHHIESIHDNIIHAERSMYNNRTIVKGVQEPLVDYDGFGFPENTRIRIDKWGDPTNQADIMFYMGRDYGGNAYELLSMGSEGIYGFNLRVTERLLEDPELYDFFLGLFATL